MYQVLLLHGRGNSNLFVASLILADITVLSSVGTRVPGSHSSMLYRTANDRSATLQSGRTCEISGYRHQQEASYKILARPPVHSKPLLRTSIVLPAYVLEVVPSRLVPSTQECIMFGLTTSISVLGRSGRQPCGTDDCLLLRVAIVVKANYYIVHTVYVLYL